MKTTGNFIKIRQLLPLLVVFLMSFQVIFGTTAAFAKENNQREQGNSFENREDKDDKKSDDKKDDKKSDDKEKNNDKDQKEEKDRDQKRDEDKDKDEDKKEDRDHDEDRDDDKKCDEDRDSERRHESKDDKDCKKEDPKKKVTLVYNGNGATSGTAPVSEEYKEGATVTVKGAGNLLKTGYSFVGWSNCKCDGSEVFVADDTFKITKDVELCAKWQINKYDVTFDVDGVKTTKQVEFGAAIEVPANPTKIGYTFAGWLPVVPEKMPAEDQLFVAQWNPVLVTVEYKAGIGGTIDGFSSKSQNINYGANTTSVTAVASSKYHFIGWSDGVTTATRSDLNVTASKTITANFAANIVTTVVSSVFKPAGQILPTAAAVVKADDKVAVKGAEDVKKDCESCDNTDGCNWFWWLILGIAIGVAGYWFVSSFIIKRQPVTKGKK